MLICTTAQLRTACRPFLLCDWLYFREGKALRKDKGLSGRLQLRTWIRCISVKQNYIKLCKKKPLFFVMPIIFDYCNKWQAPNAQWLVILIMCVCYVTVCFVFLKCFVLFCFFQFIINTGWMDFWPIVVLKMTQNARYYVSLFKFIFSHEKM